MQAKLAEAGGLEGLQEILVVGHGQLAFLYGDGRRVELPWSNPSRSQSWTPEMKEAANGGPGLPFWSLIKFWLFRHRQKAAKS